MWIKLEIKGGRDVKGSVDPSESLLVLPHCSDDTNRCLGCCTTPFHRLEAVRQGGTEHGSRLPNQMTRWHTTWIQ